MFVPLLGCLCTYAQVKTKKIFFFWRNFLGVGVGGDLYGYDFGLNCWIFNGIVCWDRLILVICDMGCSWSLLVTWVALEAYSKVGFLGFLYFYGTELDSWFGVIYCTHSSISLKSFVIWGDPIMWISVWLMRKLRVKGRKLNFCVKC